MNEQDRNGERVVVISDLHCGHRAGMTPPSWQMKPDEKLSEKTKWSCLEKEMWNWYSDVAALIQPVDILVVNGDSIEGNGAKSGGTELIVRDRNEQAKMAVRVIEELKPKVIRMVRGSSGHSGTEEDWEDLVAEKLGCEIVDHKFMDVNGLVFDFKHFIGNSNNPHTRNNPVLKDSLWNLLWHKKGDQPLAHVVVRSHQHFYTDVAGIRPNTRAFVTPSLQGPGSKFGNRYCSKLVDVGLICFDVESEKKWTFQAHLADLRSLALFAEKL